MAKAAREVSEIREICRSSRFEWKLPLLYSVVQRTGDACQSRPHTFCNSEWTFTLTKRLFSVEVHLNRLAGTLSHENDAVCKLFRIALDGAEAYVGVSQHKFFVEDRNRSVLAASQTQYQDQRNFGVKIICLLDCFNCKSEAPFVLRKYAGALGRDLLDLLTSGEDSDVTINVKERVFRVHKNIIRARSPVFFSMLKHDMTEKRSGSVDIPDCDPDAFQKFLEHMYSGELKDLSEDVVYSVYYIANKYQVSEVTEECFKFMSENLSLETFYNVAELSIRHEELELFERASQFFKKNTNDIIQTDRWVTFLGENPVAANDFFKKLLIPEVTHVKKRKLESTKEKGVIFKKT